MPNPSNPTLAMFRAARRVSAPIVSIKTTDQFAVVQLIEESLNGSAPPMLTWDIGRGLRGINEAGREALADDLGDPEPVTTQNPTEAIGKAVGLPKKSILFCYNAHRVIGDETVSQAIWNLREEFKKDTRTLVLLGPDMPLPAELQGDVLVIDDQLPTETELRAIIDELVSAAASEMSAIREKATPDVREKAVEALAGLGAFPAEQALAMSISTNGIDLDGLWERKRQAIEQAPGLSVYRGKETFDEIGGIENAKTFGKAILAGNNAPRAVVFIDEIEKHMAGVAGDTSGVSQELLGTQLSWMQDKGVTGMLLVGPPGAAKSAFAKALGNTGKIPTIVFDLSGMKGSLVGESGRNMRQALKVVDAVSQGKALVVATCNSLGILPPELRRRFTFGTFFFDLPTPTEQDVIWKLYLKSFGLKKQALPKHEGWTGAEIRTCCDIAFRLNISLADAAKFVVPVAKSAKDQIAKLRSEASNRFISASEPGIYVLDEGVRSPSKTTRQFDVSDN